MPREAEGITDEEAKEVIDHLMDLIEEGRLSLIDSYLDRTEVLPALQRAFEALDKAIARRRVGE